MRLSFRVLGAGVVRDLSARADAPVLIIGTDAYTRADLARVGCYNYVAAITLTRAIAYRLGGVKNLQHLFETIPPSALVLPTVGAISLAVLGAAFELAGLGGAQPLEAWVALHRPEGAREFVTFDTLKHQAAAREAPARRAARRRGDHQSRRRDQAQRLRGDRYITRQTRRSATK